MFVDSHCHLNLPPLKDALDMYIANALKYGVDYMQTICTKLSDIDELISIVEKYENIFTSVGIHPNEVLENSSDLTSKIIHLAKKHPKIIGIGETGLDYYKSNNGNALQKNNFISHIHAAQETGLPIIIHTREAENDTMDILEAEMRNKSFKGLIHCFTSTKELAYRALDLGFYISLSGVITFKNATNLQEIVMQLPLTSLLIETDAPYLAPHPKRGEKNEPAYVSYVAEKLASLKNVDINTIALQTSKNFFSLFSKCRM